MKNLYCIVGPSGCGKSTLAHKLQENYGLRPVVSFTTRPMRQGELEGVDHYYVSDEAFDDLGEMAAFTEFDGYRYGVPRKLLENCDVYVIDPAGVAYMKTRVPDCNIVVLGIDPGPVVCINRMKERGDSDEKIRKRIQNDAVMICNIPEISDIMLDASLKPDELAKQAMGFIRQYEAEHM